MSSISFLKIPECENNFVYYKDLHEIFIQNKDFPLLYPKVDPLKKDFKIDVSLKNSELSFVSEKNKIFITLSNNYNHFLNDCLGSLIKQYELLENSELILDMSMFENEQDCSFYKFFLKTLNDKNISYKLINCKNISKIIANNFYVMNNFYPGINNAEAIVSNFYMPYIKNIGAQPYRKVYLARVVHNRIKNIKELENYLKNNNFEIIIPEDNFKNFEDQINYFYNVKTLISPSGSGLANSIFMQESTNVVELITPIDFLISNEKETHLHHYWFLHAFNKKQKYFGISNENNNIVKQLDDIMEIL
jgi:hypothetical protein